MAMGDQLACRTSRVRKTETENDVVEPSLEKLEQGFARDATSLEGSLEDSAKLLFHQAVLETKLLLFAERDCVVRLFAAGSFRTVHSRRIVLPLERLGGSEKWHTVSAGDFCFGSGISGHGDDESLMHAIRIRRAFVSAGGTHCAAPV